MNNNILPLLPKIYFPGAVFLGPKSPDFLKSISGFKKIVVTASLFKESNKEVFDGLFGDSAECFFQDREPHVEDLEKLKKRCADNGCDYLVAIGGGSVIDLAKMAKRELRKKMVAMPTTIGSGAEASQHVVLIENGAKKVFSSPEFLPEIVILNPNYLKTLTEKQVVYQSIDALAHAFEALVSRMSNTLSDSISLNSINIIYRNLKKIAEGTKMDKVLEEIQIGSFLSGIAQSSVGTGLCHALAHYFGAKNNISHSAAIAIFLLDVLNLNNGHSDKYKKLDQSKELTSQNFLEKLTKLFYDLKIEPEKVVLSEEPEKIAEIVRRDICTITNPYAPRASDIVEIIKHHK